MSTAVLQCMAQGSFSSKKSRRQAYSLHFVLDPITLPGQAMHAHCPAAGWYVPAGQGLQRSAHVSNMQKGSVNQLKAGCWTPAPHQGRSHTLITLTLPAQSFSLQARTLPLS